MIRNKIVLGFLVLSGSHVYAEKALEDGGVKEIATTDVSDKKVKQAVTSQEKKKSVPKTSSKKVQKVSSPKKQIKDTAIQVVDKKVSSSKKEEVASRKVCNRIVIRIPSIGIDGAKDMVITERMLTIKSLEGRERSKEDIIFENLVFDKAVNGYHMTPATHEAEQHIEGLKSQYGLGQKEIEKIFKESGMTYEEGVEQLVMFYTNRAFISNLVTSKVLVTEEEIKKYHEEHPQVVPTSYKIEKSFIEKSSVAQEAIENLRKYGLGQDNVVWQPAYWITEEDLVESKKFITKMHEGVVKVIDAGDNWEVIRLIKKIEKHTKLLSERYREITEKLQYEKFQEKLAEFKKELLKEYDVIEIV